MKATHYVPGTGPAHGRGWHHVNGTIAFHVPSPFTYHCLSHALRAWSHVLQAHPPPSVAPGCSPQEPNPASGHLGGRQWNRKLRCGLGACGRHLEDPDRCHQLHPQGCHLLVFTIALTRTTPLYPYTPHPNPPPRLPARCRLALAVAAPRSPLRCLQGRTVACWHVPSGGMHTPS